MLNVNDAIELNTKTAKKSVVRGLKKSEHVHKSKLNTRYILYIHR